MRYRQLVIVSLLAGVTTLILTQSAQAIAPSGPANKPCTNLPTSVVGDHTAILPTLCPLGTSPPVTRQQAVAQMDPLNLPETKLPERQPRTRGDDIDDWIQEQIDRPIMAIRGFYETSVLVSPSLGHPDRAGVRGTWGNLLYLGILICLLAWVLHVGHAFHGTDQRLGRNPLLRLGVPGICLVLMIMVPTGYEALQSFQEYVWRSDLLDPHDADSVLSVVLPPAPMIDDGGQVTYTPAGSIAPIRAKLGSVFGVGVGLCVLITGLLGGLKTLLADFLIVTCPLYLGISAVAHDLAPAKRWLSVLVRTALLTSLFNAGWLTMQYLPGWMYWSLVDAVVFVALVLPAMLLLAYVLWYRPLVEAVRMEANWAGELFRHLKTLRGR